jgi:uncharacterized protein
VIDAATGGLVGVSQVRFTLRAGTREALREEALRRAVANARSAAGVLAESADLTLDGIRTLSTASEDLIGIVVEAHSSSTPNRTTSVVCTPERYDWLR